MMDAQEILNKMTPEGWKIVDFRTPKIGEFYLSIEGNVLERYYGKDVGVHLILEEVWTPKKGEVIMVWDIDPNDTRPSVFKSMSSDGRYKASATGSAFGSAWQYARPLTAEEKGE